MNHIVLPTTRTRFESSIPIGLKVASSRRNVRQRVGPGQRLGNVQWSGHDACGECFGIVGRLVRVTTAQKRDNEVYRRPTKGWWRRRWRGEQFSGVEGCNLCSIRRIALGKYCTLCRVNRCRAPVYGNLLTNSYFV